MQFNSLEFLVFFFLVVSAYFSLPLRWRWVLLLVASCYFYMAWNAKYIVLVMISTVVDYFAALGMTRSDNRAARRAYLASSMTANLSLLFAFKYFNFLSAAAAGCLGALGFSIAPHYLDVLLPVGISFYTFQTMSYTIEVYLGRQQAEPNLGRFALYVMYFPQLVAGPIERPQNLLPQLFRKHDFDYARTRAGLQLMLWGMFKKVVVADRLSVIVDHIYGQPERYPGMMLAIASVLFAFQIYCDFSGYSDIAIGAARIMGVDLMRNFNRPYAAVSIQDFWRRWHISLSTWFRDYVFIPLGGSKVSDARRAVNLMTVFVISGIWHGANWTFLVWGALHGTYYTMGWLTRGVRERFAQAVGLERLPRTRHALQVGVTFLLVCFAWIFFRAASLPQALDILRRMPTGWTDLEVYGGFSRLVHAMDISVPAFAISVAAIGVVLWIEHRCKDAGVVELLDTKPRWMRWLIYISAGFAIMNLGVAEEIPFVYFQF